jgi:hypothetical protein
LQWKGNQRMTLELYNSLAWHVLLHTPCIKFFTVKDLRNTPYTSNFWMPKLHLSVQDERNNMNMLWTNESFGLHGQRYLKYHQKTVV